MSEIDRRSRPTRAVVLTLLCALTGCVRYQPAPIDLKSAADRFSAAGLPAATVTSPRTWNRAELLAVALMQNPRLEVARQRELTALAGETSVAEYPNPDLTLQSEYARHDEHPWLYGLATNWLLRSPARRRLELQIAQSDTGVAKLELMDQAWGIRRALTEALSAREWASRQVAVLERLAKSQDALLQIEKRRIAAGEDSPSEVAAAQIERVNIERLVAEQHARADSAASRIAAALGVPPQALDGKVLEWPEWGEPPAVDTTMQDAARERALLSRADLGAAIQRYSTAEAKLKLAITRQHPEFELGPGYYWDHGIAKFPLNLGFTLPLNGNAGEIAEARAARELAGSEMLALQAEISGAATAAARAEQIARANVEAAERQSKLALRQSDLTALAVRLGESAEPERITAELLMARTDLEVVDAHAQLQQARDALEDVLHAPLSGPELALDDKFWPTVAEMR